MSTRLLTRPVTLLAAALGAVVAAILVVPLAQDGPGEARIQAGAPAFRASSGVLPAVVEDILEPTTAVPTSAPTTVPRLTTTTTPPPVVVVGGPVTPLVSTLVAALPPLTPSTVAATTADAPASSTSTTRPPVTTGSISTTTTVAACRNSTDPDCGPFRFDPQPGADRPMTVEVVTEPATPRAGQEVLFRITLTDPDGVSHGSSLYGYGDSGIGEISSEPCGKYGPWDPPAPDPAHAVEVHSIPHTYAQAGTYQTSFTFDAGPFDCTDVATGRGDRPYASSAGATLTVVVAP